jgi:hypothetical protein
MVLVWFSSPGGSSIIPEIGVRIYGCMLPYPPRDIPEEIYKKYINDFIQAPYTANWIAYYFGPENVEDIAFTYDEIKLMPREALQKIARGMKIKFRGCGSGAASHRKLSRAILTKIRSIHGLKARKKYSPRKLRLSAPENE